jgi:hypothetical protein
MNVSVALRSKTPRAATPVKALAAGSPAPPALVLMDVNDDSFTVQGVDAAGAPVDISAVATIAVTSDTPTVLSVDPPVGMTCAIHALLPGTATLTITATWNDGSAGPFTVTWPITVTGGPATGLIITPGTPTVR